MQTNAEHNDTWKGRGTLANLVQELQRQKESKVDFVADVRQLAYSFQDGNASLIPLQDTSEWMPNGAAQILDQALTQMFERTSPPIPTRFGRALMEEKTNALEHLVQDLHANGGKRLVRMMDGKVRGWLSDRYRVMDHEDLAFACLEEAQRCNAQVIEANLTDKNMRIKFTSQAVWSTLDAAQRDGKSGLHDWFTGAKGNKELIGKLGSTFDRELPGGPDTVHPVVTVRNSETGHGGLGVRIGLLNRICLNMCILEDVITQIHLGERLDSGVFTAQTITEDSKVIMMKAKDAVRAAFDPDKFKAMIAKAKGAQSDVIEKPSAAVENLITSDRIPEERKEALLEYFLRDYDSTRWGLAQAVSRLAQDEPDGDEAETYEMLAGGIISGKVVIA